MPRKFDIVVDHCSHCPSHHEGLAFDHCGTFKDDEGSDVIKYDNDFKNGFPTKLCKLKEV